MHSEMICCSLYASWKTFSLPLARRDKPLTVSPATATAAFQALPQRQGQPTKYKNSTLLGFLQDNFGPPGRCIQGHAGHDRMHACMLSVLMLHISCGLNVKPSLSRVYTHQPGKMHPCLVCAVS